MILTTIREARSSPSDVWLVLYGSSSIQLACVQSVFGDCDLNSARSRVLTRVVDERCVLPSMKLHMVLTTMRGGHRSSPSDVWLVLYGSSSIQLACVPSVFRDLDLSSARPFFMPARGRSGMPQACETESRMASIPTPCGFSRPPSAVPML